MVRVGALTTISIKLRSRCAGLESAHRISFYHDADKAA